MKGLDQRNSHIKKNEEGMKKKNQKSSRIAKNTGETEKTSRNNQEMIESLLSPQTAKMMSGFTNGQKKIIQKQFLKMMKKIKKQLTSPQKNMENCTQRTNFVEFTQCNSKTARKGHYSDRNLVSPSKKAKDNGNNFSCISPNQKKTKKNWTTNTLTNRKQKITSQLKSPKKYKTVKLINNQTSKQKIKKNNEKPKEIHYHSHRNKNYFLFGGQFIKMDQKVTKNYEQQILLANDINFQEERDSELQDAWKDRLDGNKKRKDRIQSAEQVGSSKKIIYSNFQKQFEDQTILKNEESEKRANQLKNQQNFDQNKSIVKNQLSFDDNRSMSINQFKQSSEQFKKLVDSRSIISNFQEILTPFTVQNQLNTDKERKKMREEIEKQLSFQEQDKFCEDFPASHKNFVKEKEFTCRKLPKLSKQQIDEYSGSENLCETFSQVDFSPIRNITHLQEKQKKQQNLGEDMIEMRTNVVNIQMKTNKQILDRLLNSEKINRRQYQNYLDKIMQNYTQEISEIERLKDLMDKNEEKVEQIIKQTRKNLQFTEKLWQKNPYEILEKMFQNYQKQGDCHKQFYSHQAGKQSIEQSRQKFERVKTFNQKDILCEKMKEEEEANRTKQAIELRIANQLGLFTQKKTDGCKINTSVSSVYQFIKLFFGFVLKNFKQDFLRYINMPYGYSVSQRLTMMQGYQQSDEQLIKEDQDGIMYGLQQVIQPQIFQKFYQQYMNKARPNVQQRQIQKIHNQAIFDGINQLLNEYRPYYHINGVPYLWSTSEKGLTFFYISQQNIEEVIDKVQIDLLKNASSFCGIIIPEATQHLTPINTPENRQLSEDQSGNCLLEEVFEKYTNQTPQQILKDRQNRLMKSQKKQLGTNNFEWINFDEYQTALFYEISSLILEDLAQQITFFTYNSKIERNYQFIV